MAMHLTPGNVPAETTVVVAGDVCIDWLSIPVESIVPGRGQSQPMNWQLRGGRHMYARRGGAWLTADFVGAAVDKVATVQKPEAEQNLESVPPEVIIHSMMMLGPADRVRNHENVPHWVVTNFEGYAGPTDPGKPKVKPVEHDTRNSQVVVLDDAGNGFRDTERAWPLALNDGCKPLMLYKVRRPLGKGGLWERLKAFHPGRTVALLRVDELRGEGGSISRELSWERTATDLVLSLAREPTFAGLRSCPFLIISLGIEGAVLVRCENDQLSSAHLWYYPNLTEGELLRAGRGDMSGFGSAFAAVLAASLVAASSSAHDLDKIDSHLRDGIRRGLAVMYSLLEEAFGPCHEEDPQDITRRVRRPPQYPVKPELFQATSKYESAVFDVRLPPPPDQRSSKATQDFRSWRILESNRKKVFAHLAADVALRGAENVFKDIPAGHFGKASSIVRLTTLERSEIESYRSIRNLIREFLDNPRPERPLCLAVFGAPGSGKSFGVTQVARSLDTEGRIEKLDFNVSQWNSPDYLVNALHRVRDHAIQGRVPLVFFDEFDSQLGRQRLGWLRYFLAPMQDGVFADGLFTHDIGKAIFVFAGGTADTFAEFSKGLTFAGGAKAPAGPGATQDAPGGQASAWAAQAGAATGKTPHAATLDGEDVKGIKLPDFVSRLRGHVDVFGLDPPVDTNLLRRALVLRSNILKKFPTLKDASGALRIDSGVLRAFLQVPGYSHGARSIEAILDMSRLVGRTHFDPSLLPPLHQLNLHVDGNAFMALVQHQQLLGAKLEDIARAIHELYLKEELDKKDEQGNPVNEIGGRPALQHWENLGENYRRSNREQAANYPTLLAAAGCGFKEGDHDPAFTFTDEEIERLARMEHERWLQERRIKQPDHPDLVPWAGLPEEEKKKDIRAITALPKILGEVGLQVVRLV